MSARNSAAIVGLGPVALATARLLQKSGIEYSFLSRRSPRSEQRKQFLEGAGIEFCALSSKPDLEHWNGSIQGQVHFFDDLPEGQEPLEHLFVAVPHTAYLEVLGFLKHLSFKTVVLLSPGLFSGELVGATVPDKSVVSLSNFWGAAKFLNDSLVLKAVKKKIYIGGPNATIVQDVSGYFQRAGLTLSPVCSSLEAEFRNITLYVHPVLSMAPLVLRAVFCLNPIPKYLYKLYPEGPIERRRMKLYASFSGEVMRVGQSFGLNSFNLLAFLHRDNYRVPSCFLEEHEVDSFPSLSTERQGDLLYARYSGLLVDSNAAPDQDGRYFDFSAVPVVKVNFDKENLTLPRLLTEDIYHLCLLRALSRKLHLPCPTIDTLCTDLTKVLSELSASVHEVMNDHIRSVKSEVERRVETLLSSREKSTRA